MIRYPALRHLRVGCVRYANAKPLIHRYDAPLVLDHPSRLAEALRTGTLDVGLVPVVELFASPNYVVVDGVAIASRGPVYSVILAFRGELSQVQRVVLDPGSLTSIYLLRCLLSKCYGLRPQYDAQQHSSQDGALLLIGNQALDFRATYGSTYSYLDLGQAWAEWTGLPFVYALWLLSPGVKAPAAVAEELRMLKKAGVAAVEEIVAHQPVQNRDFYRRYLGGHVQYDLGEDGKAGLLRFRELLLDNELLSAAPANFQFV